MVTSAARLGVAVLVGLALAVSCTALAASAFEQWGTSHFDEGALRMSLRLQPGRLWAAELVAVSRALDGRSGDRAAAEEARTPIETAVREHPWDTNVRLVAANVERLLFDPAGARAWGDRQRMRFPSDRFVIPTGPQTAVSDPSG